MTMAIESGSKRAWSAVVGLGTSLVVGLFVISCARNPVTGNRELMLVSESQEIEMGRQAAASVPAELGLLEDQDVQRMVSEAGLRMARASERPELPWEFRVVDSPVVNAFALPGGFIFLTRGILTHMNSEAEMVGVLGHEIGHVTARHSAQQISQSQLAGLGLGLSMIFVPEVRPYGDVLQTGVGLMFLKFGRDDEREADRLGVRYSLQSGYDPRRMAAFFDVLDRMRESSGEVLPGWLATHPDPADREERILELVHESGVDPNLRIAEETFKRRIEGLVFGENPREGFMDGNVFKHPELRFQIVFPPSFQVQNTKQAVFAGNNRGAFQLTASNVDGNASLAAHLRRLLQGSNIETAQGRAINVGGFDAYATSFRAATSAGIVAGEAAVIRDGSLMYELLAYTPQGSYRASRNDLLAIIESFSRLTDREALNVQPQRVRLYRVPREMSAREALRGSGVAEDQLEQLALVNHLRLDDLVSRGFLLKSVSGSELGRATQP